MPVSSRKLDFESDDCLIGAESCQRCRLLSLGRPERVMRQLTRRGES
jgi:hypothetical protein